MTEESGGTKEQSEDVLICFSHNFEQLKGKVI